MQSNFIFCGDNPQKRKSYHDASIHIKEKFENENCLGLDVND